MKQDLRTIVALLFMVVAFYWKITLTKQYTLYGTPEAQRIVADISETVQPWSPALLRDGRVREGYLRWYFVASHWLAAVAAFALCRSLGTGHIAAASAGIVFAVGGVMGTARDPAESMAILLMASSAALAVRAAHGPLPWAIALGAITLLQGATRVPGLPQLTALVVLGVWIAVIRRDRGRAIHGAAWAVLALGGWVAFPPTGLAAYRDHHLASVNPADVYSVLLPIPSSREELFMGAAASILAVAGLWLHRDRAVVKWVAVVALVFLLFSFGAFTFVHGVLYSLVSRIAMVPPPTAAIPFFQLGLAVLFGLGADAGPASAEPVPWIRWISVGLGTFFMFSAQVVIWTGRSLDLDRMILSGSCAIAASLILGPPFRGALSEAGARAAILGLSLIELTGHANTVLSRS